jgi:signal transduction histidine kinase/DNA-binding NarL/FixJ family response regulator
MKTILVLAQHPELPEAIRSALKPDEYRLIHRLGCAEAEPFLHQRLVDFCIFDADSTNVPAMWSIEKLRRQIPACPLIVYTGSNPWEWEEEAYLQGVRHVLNKPVRPRLLTVVLERLGSAPHAPTAPVSPRPRLPEPSKSPESNPREFHALEVLRDFSAILTHSLCAEALLKQFLLLLREILGVNRALVFLRRPATSFGAKPLEEGACLRAACAIGLSSGLLEHFELSTDSGVGGHLYRQGRVLRRESEVAQADVEIQKEFELMGAEVAIPILDRETFLGVAAFDGRVTGEPLANSELELIFHLLEEVGLAVKNIWLHDQLAANHEMMTDILRQLSSACIVVSRDLAVLHANKAARNFFARPGRRHAEVEFSDLPQLLGTKIYQVLKTGTAITTFKYQPPDSPGSIYQVSILPFQKQDAALPSSALLVAEDHTQTDQIQRLELEAANLRLIRTMADRLAHEIGNALVPISTHQQMLASSYSDPEFRSSLNTALSDSVKRITRFTNQMRFLAQESVLTREAFPLEPLIEEAFEEAKKYQPVRTSRLTYDNGVQPVIVAGDRAALKHAFTEVLINALQANPADAKIGVRAHPDLEGNGSRAIRIEVQDNGPGFTSELMDRPLEPFFTTRNVGLGLGLAVSRKIIETHQGRLALGNSPESHSGVVRISLPASLPPGAHQ